LVWYRPSVAVANVSCDHARREPGSNLCKSLIAVHTGNWLPKRSACPVHEPRARYLGIFWVSTGIRQQQPFGSRKQVKVDRARLFCEKRAVNMLRVNDSFNR